MKLKLNDKVLVISGKDKGKSGKIIKIDHKHNRVTVEKVNIRTKHIRKTQQGPGDRIQYEAPVHASNVMILDPKENKPTRVGYKMNDKGKKERFAKLSGASLDGTPKPSKKAAPKADKKDAKATKSKKKVIKA